jgi:hypothetical protein
LPEAKAEPKRSRTRVQRPKDKTWPGKTFSVTLSVYPRDDALAQELEEFFGTSQSDVYRTAIRNLYTQTLGMRK